MKKLIRLVSVTAFAFGVVVVPSSVHAALTDSTNLTQAITNGTIAAFIGDTGGSVVATPNVSFPSQSVSGTMQTSVSTLGTNTERIYVDNPGGADNGWTLALAATSGPTASWTSGLDTYAFNAAIAANGQLTVNPAVGTLTAGLGTTTGISLGSSSTFNSGVVDSVNLLTAAAGADDINRVYLTGVSMSQTIPAGTPAGSYTIDFTQTVAAL